MATNFETKLTTTRPRER